MMLAKIRLWCILKDCFKINRIQRITLPNKVEFVKFKNEFVKFKNVERKMKSPFMIYSDFEIILVLEDNGKQNPNESYNKNIKNMSLVVMVMN